MSQRPDDPDNGRIKTVFRKGITEVVGQEEKRVEEVLLHEEEFINAMLQRAGYPKVNTTHDGSISPPFPWFYLLTAALLLVLLCNGFLVYQSLEQTRQMQTVIEQLDR
ncbi:MAG TPA: hypothetical protein V6D02_04570 [Candidatus Obscuribacterales bacterium]